MATDIDILLSRTPTKLKRLKVTFTSQKAFQGATQCSATCPTCHNSCTLQANHTVEHKCSNGHQWATDIPGPH